MEFGKGTVEENGGILNTVPHLALTETHVTEWRNEGLLPPISVCALPLILNKGNMTSGDWILRPVAWTVSLNLPSTLQLKAAVMPFLFLEK